MQYQRIKQQQQALMQQALLQQQSLYHPGILTPPQATVVLEVCCRFGGKSLAFLSLKKRLTVGFSWNSCSILIEPIPSGNLPPGFDPSTCRSVYVGNIHTQVTEPLLQEVFASTGPVESCKLVRKDKPFDCCIIVLLVCTLLEQSSYGFVHYFDRRSATLAILSLNGRHLFGQPIKVNWAYASGQREDTSGHFNIFVGDLSPEVTDAMLFACFSVYPSCSDARVMWDQKTGRSRGYGFVSFRNQKEAQSAINYLSGKWLGSRQIRCNWATKGATSSDDKQSSDVKSVVELTNDSSEDGKGTTNTEAPENNPQYTTVYVGNLAPEASDHLRQLFSMLHIQFIMELGATKHYEFTFIGQMKWVTQLELHHHFHALGAGVIEEVRVQRDKGFGFVRYSTHAEAALAIQMGNTQSFLFGKQIKCSWGSKPTPPGTSSNPLPPPAAPLHGLSAADLLAYERQLAMSKMGIHALMQPQGQHPLKPGAMGVGAAGGSQAIYDGGFQNVAAAQQLMYYQ
ncbi:Oligouridylate-binding protein 1A [Hibiscus syriacus]|uniref:Oligouridylate-binding protein 1A n=1 Tax=Hibiscus syriacus TaxID=106335 RepID=A0A6A2XHP5_HIBSY|nr:Oligouridylate-binding protein 1A [Hibiscus syriacus]